MNKDIQKKNFELETNDIISASIGAVLEGVTGVLASSKKDLILSLGHIFQRMRGGQFLSQLQVEWNRLKEKGRVKDDYQHAEQHKVCLQELLDSLDNDLVDEVRFKVLKNIFLVAASEDISDRNSLLPQQFMRIARDLSSGEIIVLNAVYKLYNDADSVNLNSKGVLASEDWLEKVANGSGLIHEELVETHEEKLVDKKLLVPSKDTIRLNKAVEVFPYYGLTNLGYEFCKYIAYYDEDIVNE